MPLYQYHCDDCASTIERKQTFSEPPLVECPDCGGKLRRVFHPVGIIFKGSGWYCTDHRSKSYSSEESGSKECCGAASTSDAKECCGAASTSSSKTEAA